MRKLLLLIGSVLLALLAAEALVRLLPDATLGFVYRNERFERPQEFPVDLTHNRFGSHDVDYPPKRPGVRRILLLGDSFVQGLAVSIEETISRRLDAYLREARPHAYDVVCLAGPGLGPRQELAVLDRFGPELEPDLVVTVFYMNDVPQALPDDRMRDLVSQPGVVRLTQRPDAFAADEAIGFWLRTSMLNRLLSYRLTLARNKRTASGIPFPFLVYALPVAPIWEEAWLATEQVLLATRESARRMGAEYALVSVGSPFGVEGEPGLARLLDTYPTMRGRRWDFDEPDRRLSAFTQTHEIPFLALQPLFRAEGLRGGPPLHWMWDGHWTAAGHDLAARHIAPFVVRLKP